MTDKQKEYLEEGLKNGSIVRWSDLAYADDNEEASEDDERCCGNCCWFYGENTDGEGFCAEAKESTWKDFTYCDKKCWLARGGCDNPCYVSRQDMRHHMAVLLRMTRHKRRPDECKAPPYQHEVEALVFAYKYLEVFSNL